MHQRFESRERTVQDGAGAEAQPTREDSAPAGYVGNGVDSGDGRLSLKLSEQDEGTVRHRPQEEESEARGPQQHRSCSQRSKAGQTRLTRELPVSSTFSLQVSQIRMHQKSRIVAPDTRLCHSCFQCLKNLLLCHMKYT